MITIRAIIEIVGFPEEHVNKTIEQVLEKLKKEKDIQISKERLEVAEKVKEMWSAFIEVELKIKNIETFFEFSFNYLPTTIEFLDTKEFTFPVQELNRAMNDMLNYMHRYHQALSNLTAQNEIYKVKLEKLTSQKKSSRQNA